jgi:hypothetical protein
MVVHAARDSTIPSYSYTQKDSRDRGRNQGSRSPRAPGGPDHGRSSEFKHVLPIRRSGG